MHYFNFSNEENIKKRNERLEEILSHAKKNVLFYKKIEAEKLEQFPVVNKTIIKENYNNFIATNFNIKNLSFVTTSGSTGTPFKSFRDKGKIVRHNADNIFFNSLVGGDIGLKLYYFRVWNSINRKGYFKKVIQNIEEIDANNFTDDYVISLIDKINNDSSTKYMLSYASSYEALAQTMNKLNLSATESNIKAIIAMSESLPEGTRSYLEKKFNAQLFSRYSNMENGFIGQQCSEHKNEYHLNSGSFLVEILDIDSDRVVKDGELGRIVITDFFNYAMPFIRYDTGDLGIKAMSECSVKGPVLTKVEGRKTDFIYSTSGQMLSPHIITNTMWKFSDIRQFQFIQRGVAHYVLILNTDKAVNESLFQEEFKSFLGTDATISVEYVDEIPLLASGKRRKVVQEYFI